MAGRRPQSEEDALAGMLQQLLAATQQGTRGANPGSDLAARGAPLLMQSGEIPGDDMDGRPESAPPLTTVPDDASAAGSDVSNASSSEDIAPSALVNPQARRDRQTRDFLEEHSISPAQLPSQEGADPFRDEDVSVASMLQAEGARPVNISELNMVSRSRGRDLGPRQRTVIKVSNLLLITKLVRPATPIALGRFSLQIKDIEGHTVSVIVQLNPDGMEPLEFATDLAKRFVPGTTLIMRNIIMAIESDGYFLLLDMQDEDSEIFCAGDDPLPGPQVSQIAGQCDQLTDMGEYGSALACALEGLDRQRDILSKAVQVLTNLAIAHVKLSYKGVALAYAVSVVRLMMKDTPFRPAVIAANILSEMKFETAPHIVMLKCDCEDAPSEVTWMHAVSKATAKSHLHDDDVRDASEKFRAAGLREVAEALVKVEAQWTSHSLGECSQVQSTAEEAKEASGEEAVPSLCSQAESQYKRGSITRAILLWRAAIWLMFDKQHSADLYFVWDILNTRHSLWEKAEATTIDEARSDHYLDLVTLSMLRSSHVAHDNLLHNVILAKCKLGQYKDVTIKAVKEAAQQVLNELA